MRKMQHLFCQLFLALLITLAMLSYSQKVIAQKTEVKFINQKSLGAFVSTGFALYAIENGEKYQPILIGGVLHLPFYQTHGKFNVAIDLMPQFGIVPYNNKMEYEFGFNFIFNFGFQVTENSILSISIGSGPHYITSSNDRQAPGFIFSDHLNIGYRHKFKSWQAGFSSGIRHVSNAGLEEPNLGIDSLGVGISVAKLF